MKKKQVVIAAVVWILSLLMVGKCVWNLRAEQYRDAAAENLRVEILSTCHQSYLTIGDGNDVDAERLADLFLAADAARRVAVDIYRPEGLGMMNSGSSVWLSCAEAVIGLENAQQEQAPVRYAELKSILEEYVPLLDGVPLSRQEFDRHLTALEEKLEIWQKAAIQLNV